MSILLLGLLSVVYLNTLVTPVSAPPTLPFTGQYVWMGGYLNTSFLVINLTEYGLSENVTKATMAKTVMNVSLDYWEDLENFTFTTGDTHNVVCPEAGYIAAPSPIYTAELTESFGFKTWYHIAMQWRVPSPGDGYGDVYPTAGTGDVDYYRFVTRDGQYAIKNYNTAPTVVGPGLDPDGNWIGDGNNDPAGSMWAMQPLFINVTFFLGAIPGTGQPYIAMQLVNVDMDSWLTTGDAYCNVTYPVLDADEAHPLHGMEVSGVGIEWDPEYESAAFISCGAELDMPAEFEHPISHEITPINVSYIFAHKHLACRADLVTQADANLDGFVSGWDLSRMSDYWMWNTKSEAYGQLIGEYEDAGDWAGLYAMTKGVNSVDFNGDEYVSGWDLSLLSDKWMSSGWKPPEHL